MLSLDNFIDPSGHIEIDEHVMAYLYAYFDESGHYQEHPYVIFAGLVDGLEKWMEFQNKWMPLLRESKVKELHAVKALRYSHPCGAMKAGTPEDRARDVLPFVRMITDNLALGVSVAVDVKAYEKAPQRIRRKYGPDPHYFAFDVGVRHILTHWEIPKPYTVGLICDDQEQKAMRCYSLLKKLKLRYPEAKKRITSICFSDDWAYSQLQAADLFANVSRLEAQRRFGGKDYPYRELHEAFQYVNPITGAHLHFAGGFYGDVELNTFQEP